jgi:hypothetical protein
MRERIRRWLYARLVGQADLALTLRTLLDTMERQPRQWTYLGADALTGPSFGFGTTHYTRKRGALEHDPDGTGEEHVAQQNWIVAYDGQWRYRIVPEVRP